MKYWVYYINSGTLLPLEYTIEVGAVLVTKSRGVLGVDLKPRHIPLTM